LLAEEPLASVPFLHKSLKTKGIKVSDSTVARLKKTIVEELSRPSKKDPNPPKPGKQTLQPKYGKKAVAGKRKHRKNGGTGSKAPQVWSLAIGDVNAEIDMLRKENDKLRAVIAVLL
jgi:hypothetical protein